MKKTMVLLFLAVVLMISACVTTGSAKLSGTVLYVAKIQDDGIHPHDVIIIARLEAMGLTVTPMYAKKLTGEEAEDYDYVYISESNSSGDVGAKFMFTEKPIMSCEMWVSDDLGFSGTEKNVDYGNKEHLYTKVVIAAPNHPVAAGLSGTVQVLKSDGVMGFAKAGGDVTIIASAPDDPEIAFIYVYEKGSKNKLGDTVPGLRVWNYFFENQESAATDEGWKLWEASVRYAFK